MAKIPTTFRLSDEAKDLLEGLGNKLGLNDTAVVELAVRRMAEVEKISRKVIAMTTYICEICGEAFEPGKGYAEKDYKKRQPTGTMLLYCDRHVKTHQVEIAANEAARTRKIEAWKETNNEHAKEQI